MIAVHLAAQARDTVQAEERRALLQGPRELDFVNSALAETMATAYRQIHEGWRTRELPDLRTAALCFAIRRVGESYLSQGIFP